MRDILQAVALKPLELVSVTSRNRRLYTSTPIDMAALRRHLERNTGLLKPDWKKILDRLTGEIAVCGDEVSRDVRGISSLLADSDDTARSRIHREQEPASPEKLLDEKQSASPTNILDEEQSASSDELVDGLFEGSGSRSSVAAFGKADNDATQRWSATPCNTAESMACFDEDYFGTFLGSLKTQSNSSTHGGVEARKLFDAGPPNAHELEDVLGGSTLFAASETSTTFRDMEDFSQFIDGCSTLASMARTPTPQPVSGRDKLIAFTSLMTGMDQISANK